MNVTVAGSKRDEINKKSVYGEFLNKFGRYDVINNKSAEELYEYFSRGDMTESVKNIFGAILLSQFLLGDMNFGWGDMNFISGEMNFGQKNVGAK